ncbi:MAG: hypothetical protein LUG98_09960 [Tannerellaceae bacterium]|nr:hypothetical protein [Tannerellaceae bacterium]
MIELYIDGTKAEIDQDIDINFEFSFEDLNNPTAKKNPYSRTIELKCTDVNNRLFDHIYNLDHSILNFNPNQRTGFVLTWNNQVIESGYMRLERIKRRGGIPYSYSIRLFGELGNFFYTLLYDDQGEMVRERTLRAEDLRIDEQTAPEIHARYTHVISAEAVADSWTNEHYRYLLAYKGKYENFNSQIEYDGSADPFKELPQELDEHQRNEFRAARQLPAIRFKDLFQYILDVMRGENYTFTLDPTFFNAHNPYYEKTWVTMNNYLENKTIVEEAVSGEFTARISANDNNTITAGMSSPYNPRQQPLYSLQVIQQKETSTQYAFLSFYETDSNNPAGRPGFSESQILGTTNNNGFYDITIDFYVCFFVPVGALISEYPQGSFFGTNAGSVGTARIGGDCLLAGSQTETVDTFYDDSSSGYYFSIADGSLPYMILHKDSSLSQPYLVHISKVLTGKNANVNYNLRVAGYSEGSHVDGSYVTFMETTSSGITGRSVRLPIYMGLVPASSNLGTTLPTASINFYNQEDIITGDAIEWDNLVNTGIRQYDVFLDYIKTFGLQIEVDKITKNVSILTRNSYFASPEIEDWTELVDYSKEEEIIPRAFDSKYLKMAWHDQGSYYEKKYADTYGREYGSMLIDTNYFNGQTKNLIENSYGNVVVTREKDYFFSNRHTAGTSVYDDKILPALFEVADGKRSGINSKMTLLFDSGMQTLANHSFYLSDDAPAMIVENKLCWLSPTQTNLIKRVTQVPKFTRLYTGNNGTLPGTVSLDYGRPGEVWDQETDETGYPSTATIYSIFWQRWIEERFLDDCKILECYVYLKPQDLVHFRFNRFVKIDNTLWHINKITNWSLTKMNSVKVQLIRVKDLSAYTGQSI